MPDFLLPFGPFHMVLLHLPIGALAAIWFVEFLLPNNEDKRKNPAIGLLHLFLLLSCALTIVLGLAYAEFGSYGDEIDTHELWGYIFAGCVVACYIFYWAHRLLNKHYTKVLYILALVAATITMSITGHQGGELIHGKGFLTKPFKEDRPRPVTSAPAPATAMAEGPVDPTAEAVIEPAPMTEASTEVMNDPMLPSMDPIMDEMSAMNVTPVPAVQSQANQPDPRIALFVSAQTIFERNCYKCHGPTKQKGDYRMDSKHSINLGGKSELAAIVPGKPDESELLYRMLLPRDDDDVMPPEEKDPVSAQDIEIVRQWIAEGAYWPDEAELNASKPQYIETGDANTDEWIDTINGTGAKAEYNAWGDESVRIDLSVTDSDKLEQALEQLPKFSQKLTWIDASNLKLPSDFIQQLQLFPNLQRLHLDGTNVTDAELAQLGQLPQLQYLNLYNTRTSDTGLEALQQCPNLKKVFLTNTQVTADGIAALQQATPELEVIYQ